MTNYEKIKNMTTIEMSYYFAKQFDCIYCPCLGEICNDADDCDKALKTWLESEAET